MITNPVLQDLPFSMVAPATGVAATDTANISSAFAQLGGKGGIVQLGPGTYVDSQQRTLANYQILAGAGGLSAGSGPGTLLVYNGSAVSYINAPAVVAPQIRDVMLFANNAGFTGRLIDLSNVSSLGRIRGCYLGAVDTTAATLVYLDNGEDVVISECNIVGGKYGIQGIATLNHFSSGITVLGNRIGGQGAAGAAISGPGGGWSILGNIFELQNGQGAIGAGPSPFTGIAIAGNWFGDNPASAVTVMSLFGDGGSIRGNFIGGSTTGTAIKFTGTSDGIEIAGNRFDTASLAMDKNAQAVTNIVIGPNSYTNVTTHSNFTAAGTAYIEA